MNIKAIDEKLAADAKSLPGKVYYMANGGNLGDVAIAFSEFQFFDRIGINPIQVTRENIDKIKEQPFSLIYGGGGIWTGLYDTSRQESLFKSRNLVKCLVMPSTFFNSKRVIDAFDERFTVYCRDTPSYEYCTALNGAAQFKLHHDMAFCSDISGLNIKNVQDIRSDLGRAAAAKIRGYLSKNRSMKADFLRRDKEKKHVTSASFDLSGSFILGGLGITRKLAEDGMRIMLNAINAFEEITTNRLHVAILSYRLGKKIRLYGNSYGKTFNVCKYSIPDYPGIQFMEYAEPAGAGRSLSFEDAFSRSFVITASPKRLDDFRKNMKDVCPAAEVWHAVYFKQMLSQVPKKEYGVLGCSASHLSLIRMAEFNGYDYVCVFEDDAVPNENYSKTLLEYYLRNIPDDCDILLLGSLMQHGTINKNYICRVENAYGSHAYIIFKRAYEKYRDCIKNQTYIADHIFKHLNTYAITPSMFGQKPYSDMMHHDRFHGEVRAKAEKPAASGPKKPQDISSSTKESFLMPC